MTRYESVPHKDFCVGTAKSNTKTIQKELTTFNMIEYKLNRGKAWKEIKTAKRECWQNDVNKLSYSTKPKAIWEMIRKIAGKQQTITIKHLSKDNSRITDKKLKQNCQLKLSVKTQDKTVKKQFMTIKENAKNINKTSNQKG